MEAFPRGSRWGPGSPIARGTGAAPRYIDRVNITNIRETRVVHVEKTYVNIVNVNNVTNIRYVNRTTAVTAMRHEDFAAGRSVAKTAVRVDPREMAQARVLERPQVVPTHEAIINRPPAKPVPLGIKRPDLDQRQRAWRWPRSPTRVRNLRRRRRRRPRPPCPTAWPWLRRRT